MDAGEGIGGGDGATERGVCLGGVVKEAAVAELYVSHCDALRAVGISKAEAHLGDDGGEGERHARSVCGR